MAHTKKLKPAGHSAVIEALIQPAIFLGSTLMSAIAAYVLAADYIKHILAGGAAAFDYFMVGLSGGIGFLIDMAIIVAATRYRMHKLRGDSDVQWMRLAQWVLIIGLTSETLTLLYFFYLQSPDAFPSWAGAALGWVHSFLVIFRAFLPPTIIAYFVAGVMPIVIERSDRNREIKSRTSQNIAVLVDRLTEVKDTSEPGEMLPALGALLALNSYATDDTDDHLSAQERATKDNALLERLADLHGLALHALVVAPPSVAPVASPSVVVPHVAPSQQDGEPAEPGRVRFDEGASERWDTLLGVNAE